MKFSIFFLFIIFPTLVTAQSVSIVINQPGYYTFSSLSPFPVDLNDSIITITCSNVIVDLSTGVHVQDPTSTTANFNGITINPNLSNIQIKNGTIANVSGAGISVGTNCSGIKINDVAIALTKGRAIEFLGTATNSKVSNVLMDNVTIQGCALKPTTTQVFFAQYGQNIAIKNSAINTNGTAANTLSVIKFDQCNKCFCFNTNFIANTGASLAIIDLNSCTDFIARECNLINNSSTSQDLTCIRLTTTSLSNIISACTLLNNSATNNFIGFDMQANSVGNLCGKCQIANNTGSSSTCFLITGLGSPADSKNNVFNECVTLRNTATAGDSIAFLIRNSDQGSIVKTSCAYNTSLTSTGAGIIFESGTGGNNWIIKECEIIKNVGIDHDHSFGINIITGTAHLLIKNVAFDNGALLANQIVGTGTNSITQVTSDNVNNATVPWTNIVITP